MKVWLVSSFLLLGSLFLLFASLGIARFPDLFSRLHAASKAATLGVGCVVIAFLVAFPQSYLIFKGVVIILFIFLTIPIAVHMIARATYFIKIPRWSGTVIDEFADELKKREDTSSKKEKP